MPALDSCHPQVVRALDKAGWTVSPVPHAIRIPGKRYPLLADIRASRGDTEIIIVEVKCFLDDPFADLYSAIGQYMVYRSFLRDSPTNYPLYLAIPTYAYYGILKDAGMRVINEAKIKMIVVDIDNEVIDLMDTLAPVVTKNLAEITRHEIQLYAATSDTATFCPVLDDIQKVYAVVVLEKDPVLRPAWVLVMARVAGDTVVIEEDATLDKHLVDALVINGGIPREKIIQAYQGERVSAI